jgi:hypothetical protein
MPNEPTSGSEEPPVGPSADDMRTQPGTEGSRARPTEPRPATPGAAGSTQPARKRGAPETGGRAQATTGGTTPKSPAESLPAPKGTVAAGAASGTPAPVAAGSSWPGRSRPARRGSNHRGDS